MSAAGDDEIEVELEVKRARGGSDGQQKQKQHATAASLILHRKRRWLRPTEHSAQLSHYSHSQHGVARPPLPHQLVETRTRPGLQCVCETDGQRHAGRLLLPSVASDGPLPRPLRLPQTDLWLVAEGERSGTYQLLARVHGLGRQVVYTTYHVAVSALTLGSEAQLDATGDTARPAPPICVAVTTSESPVWPVVENVSAASLRCAYGQLSVRVHARRVPHEPNFSQVDISLAGTRHNPALRLTLTPALVRAVEYSGVSGQLSVGERHWSESDGPLVLSDDEEAERQEEAFEQRVEVKRRKLAATSRDEWRSKRRTTESDSATNPQTPSLDTAASESESVEPSSPAPAAARFLAAPIPIRPLQTAAPHDPPPRSAAAPAAFNLASSYASAAAPTSERSAGFDSAPRTAWQSPRRFQEQRAVARERQKRDVQAGRDHTAQRKADVVAARKQRRKQARELKKLLRKQQTARAVHAEQTTAAETPVTPPAGTRLRVPTPTRAAPGPTALAPVSPSRWGIAPAGSTAVEDSETSDVEVVDGTDETDDDAPAQSPKRASASSTASPPASAVPNQSSSAPSPRSPASPTSTQRSSFHARANSDGGSG